MDAARRLCAENELHPNCIPSSSLIDEMDPMAKAKKKLLPKDFEAMLKKRSLTDLKALFDTCDVNARGSYNKQTALAFPECPDKLAHWLVENGADLHAVDQFGDTPLHARACHWKVRIEVLLELGADANHGDGQNAHGTPLHAAAGSYRVATAGLLLQHGARVNALTEDRQTPLEYALERCSNINIADMAALAELLLEAGARKTPAMKESVARIGTDFEFHRSNFNAKFLKATSAGLDKLYVLFGVPPAHRRVLHDGKAPIVARSARWQDQHQELWELLVPSSGAARTVQGEVVRIAGRIHDEFERNGGANWDHEYKRMADAFLVHVSSGKPLAESLLTEARKIVAKIKRKNGDTRRLCELGVKWIARNPKPRKLPSPDYER